MASNKDLPKVLVLSFSGLGSQNATGQLVGDLFANWPSDRLLQLYWAHHPKVGVRGIDLANVHPDEVLRQVRLFEPELIYLRPADNHLEYAQLTINICQKVMCPTVTHIMDDWPARQGEKENGAALVELLMQAIKQSSLCLTICREMSEAYRERYGRDFKQFANGVDVNRWDALQGPTTDAPFIVRYCGALADDMQQKSILDIGKVLKSLHQEGLNVRFEIYTMPWFQEVAKTLCDDTDCVVVNDLVNYADYPALLASANALVLAYNFDERSRRYTQYSFANKTPECLASGRPVLVYGPLNIPSVRFVSENDLGWVVMKNDLGELRKALLQIMKSRELAAQKASIARQFIFKHFDLNNIRDDFQSLLQQTLENHAMGLKSFTRDDNVAVDETQVVYEYFRRRKPDHQGMMVDVGAHHGTAFKDFLEDGWQVHGFEPDPTNYAYVSQRYGENPSVTLNQLAVGASTGDELSFYASEQSTGISSLIPFHEGHEEVAKVKTIRLDDYLAATDVAKIDFLKIDTEGFDLRVLEGFDWERFQPDVIECEYEDAKTLKIGYDLYDLGQFLVDRGYTVFISEWLPIVRYGIRHQWRQLNQFPTKNIGGKSWGNFLAFKEAISIQDAEHLFHTVLAQKNPDKVLLEPVAPQATVPSRTQSQSRTGAKAPSKPPQPALPSGAIRNHLRILKGFLSSKAGVLMSLMAGSALLLLNLESFLSGSLMDMAATASALLLVVHLIAYLMERVRFEGQNNTQTERAYGNVQQQITVMQHRLTELDRLSEAESSMRRLQKKVDALSTREATPLADKQSLSMDVKRLAEQIVELSEGLDRVTEQNMDIKRKLPEIVQMIHNTK